ncbi:MAG: septation protein A, partial [Betaproteobacteria bacterium]|nr:septation protein A [Betaproteobacteria bacterium]
IVVFFVVFKLQGIFAATAVAIATTVVLIGWQWWRKRHVDVMQWVSLGIIVVFGGATLLFHNETFIKWKPTALYWAMGASLLLSQWVWRKNLLKVLLGEQIDMPLAVWARLSLLWVVFFAAMGVLNLYVAYHYSTDTWVNFKLFGTLGLTIAFVVGQSLYLARHMKTEDSA